MAEEQTQQWPVIVYPSKLEVIEKLVVLADGVKTVEDLAGTFWKVVDGQRVSTIDTPEEFDRACNFALDCNSAEKRIDTRRTEITKPALAFQKDVNGTLNPYIDRINKVRGEVTAAAQLWKKKRDEEEKQRQEAERKKQEDEALERAQRLQAAGHTEAASQLLDIAASAPRPVASRSSVSGGSAFDVSRWRGEVADMKAICLAVAEGRIPVDKITIAQSYLNERARESKKEEVVDGIRFTAKESLGLRRS
jgi:hypothetical protein